MVIKVFHAIYLGSLTVLLLVSAQDHAPSWMDDFVADPLSRPRALSLDREKIRAFRLRPFDRFKCRRDHYMKRCGELCHCVDGLRYCCRIRKDWDSLSHAKRIQFLNVLYGISMGRYGWWRRNRYRYLLHIHKQFWTTNIHKAEQFFPWHRVYLLKIENLLRSVNCAITIPYWDWTKQPFRWWQSSVFNWRYFGANLDINSRLTSRAQCVSNGYFSRRNGFLDLENRCLVRQFTYNIAPASYPRIQTVLAYRDFRLFESALRHEHGVPHFVVGGEGSGLFFTDRAAEDPLFWLHHSNVDYQWYQRQVRYLETRYQFWGWSGLANRRLVGFPETLSVALNPFSQGQTGICVEYKENDNRYQVMLTSKRRQRNLGTLSSEKKENRQEKCEVSQRRFPKSIFTLFRTPPEEIAEFLKERISSGDCW